MAGILVVDDEKSIRFSFESFLTEEGYDVVTSPDYEDASHRLAEREFDLIFLDILLGGRTGIDLLQEARKRNPSCPVVMITGAPSIDTASEALRLGAFDYIPKPVEKKTLLHVASLALRHKRVIDANEKYRSNLEAIFRSVKDAIIMVDRDLVVVEMNEATEKICGFSRKDMIGKPFGSLPLPYHEKGLEILEKTIATKEPVEEHRLECRYENGSVQVISLTASPLLNQQSVFSGAVLVVRDETRLADLERDLGERRQFHRMIGQNERMQEIYSLIEELADFQTTVLITGESGTGKELAAEALHYGGERKDKVLVKVNCSALPETLLESELFGHVRGAFTGAVRDKIGRFQRADGGSIFLDEIGDISPGIQLRLLRVLQEMEFERVGESIPVKVDVRVIAATNRDLHEKIRHREFREDLYYRLKVIEIPLPPLRDRRDDIPFLVDHFLAKLNKKFHKDILAVSEDVQKLFLDHLWPGNVRELEHALEHAFVLCRQKIITIDHLPSGFRNFAGGKTAFLKEAGRSAPEDILGALEKADWNKSMAARLLGISRMTLYRKMQTYKIIREP